MTTTSSDRPASEGPKADWFEVVRKNVAGLRFGSVVIAVHDGRVTQVTHHDKPVEWPHLGWQRMQVQASQRRMDGSYMTDGANTCTGAAFQAANLVIGADA